MNWWLNISWYSLFCWDFLTLRKRMYFLYGAEIKVMLKGVKAGGDLVLWDLGMLGSNEKTHTLLEKESRQYYLTNFQGRCELHTWFDPSLIFWRLGLKISSYRIKNIFNPKLSGYRGDWRTLFNQFMNYLSKMQWKYAKLWFDYH